MTSALIGRKRRIVESDDDDEYDSEEIVVASPRPGRSPLHDIKPTEAQTKRRRVLECVLIPEVHRATTPPAIYNPTSTQNIHTVSSLICSPDASRLRRNVRKLSYAPQQSFDTSSEDELAASVSIPQRHSKPRHSAAKRRSHTSEDTTFDIRGSEHDLAISMSSDECDEVSASSDASSGGSSEDISDADDQIPRKKASATTRKAHPPPKTVKNGQTKNTGVANSSKQMKNLIKRGKALDFSLPPLSRVDDIFKDITTKAHSLGFEQAVKHLGGRALRVGTMCSGTESPLIALEMIRNALKADYDLDLVIDHCFSVEIEPFKQAYIERNFKPPLIFRDVVELAEAIDDEIPMATTVYGAKARVPTGIHILIAGTSCVDFSNLNKYRKDLGDTGESTKTWEGVLAYCKAHRPTIVLLENVQKAPWDRMLEAYKDAGYETAGVHVDPKRYYLPQTRQRGYMVCFDKLRMQNAGLRDLGEQWQSYMEKFQRAASSPVSAFLLPKDQINTKEDARFDDTNRRDADWVRCAERHVQYRHNERLGNARPLTHWQESGSMIVPENGSASWYHTQVERILDLLDCSQLRKAREMYDVNHKTRILDVSQNVDFQKDSIPFGITGCITPDGQFFISDAGRPLAAEECLIFQGIPLEKISFTTETPGNKQDLAGNAMTTPIIGAAILSALIPGYRLITDFSPLSERFQSVQRSQVAKLVSGDTKSTKFVSGDEEVDVATLLKSVRRVMRRCHCEGGSDITKKDLQQCVDCGHTTCISCGGNPTHNYRQNQILSKRRQLPQEFEADLRSMLPLLVELGSVKELTQVATNFVANSDNLAAYLDLVEKATAETFSLQCFRRTRYITVTYQSQKGRLELVLNDDRAEWRFFVNPPKDLPGDHALRQALVQPVGKAVIADTLFVDHWAWRVPSNKRLKVRIKGHGDHVPTWWSRMEMPDFRNHWQSEYLTVSHPSTSAALLERPIEGTYKYLPRCGTATESLYRRVDDKGDVEPMYLFLDPTRIAEPGEDSFVFATDKSRLEYDEVRPIFARLTAPWRPYDHGDSDVVVTASLDCEWVPLLGVGNLQSVEKALQIRTPTSMVETTKSTNCHQSIEVIACLTTTAASTSADMSTSRIVDLDHDAFFDDNAWVFEAMRRQLNNKEWYPFDCTNAAATCHACAPPKPSLRWRLTADGKAIEPYEDLLSAANYERLLKTRPSRIFVKVKESNDLARKPLQVKLAINLASMAHRARARLPKGATNVRFQWRLKTDFNPATNYKFRQFKLGKTKGIEPYVGTVNDEIELFPNQRLSAAWMRQQESNLGQEFTVEESEEAQLPQIGWTVELRAQATVRVRGGICAHHPGYGKTILGLDLIQSEVSDKDSVKQSNGSQDIAEGRLPTPATLVLCPSAIVDQWVTEAREKFGFHDDEIMIIKRAIDLGRVRVEKLSKVKLVVASFAVFTSDTYADRIAAFAGVPGPATNQGRGFGQWLAYATKNVLEHMPILQKSGLSKLRQHVQRVYEKNVKSEEFNAVVPSRRLRGVSDHDDANKLKAKDKNMTKAVSTSLDTSSIVGPPLEGLKFDRIICDEYHLLKPREAAAIKNLKSDKIWLFSGTPAMADFYEIAQMGEMLGVPLRVGSDSRMVMKQKNIRELRKEMTDFERFDSMRQFASEAMLSRIHEIDQSFLDTFVRRDVTDFEIPFEDRIVPVNLDLVEQILYTELSQHLNSMDMRTKKGNASKTTDREVRIYEAIASSETAEEALSKQAAFIGLGDRSLSLRSLVESHLNEVTRYKELLRSAIYKAEVEDLDKFNSWREARVHIDILGDHETFIAIREICGRTNRMVNHSNGDGDDRGVNELVDRLREAHRASRFANNVQFVREAAEYRGYTYMLCDHSNCVQYPTGSEDIAVSALCGHRICKTCYEHMREKLVSQCSVGGCLAQMKDHHLLWKSKMGNPPQSSRPQFGSKMEAATRLLIDIEKKGDQAILFVQFKDQMRDVEMALEDAGISAVVVDNVYNAGKQISEFKDAKKKKTVLVLNASDETAAGLNLQNANHVIFLSQLLREQQYAYEATMAQAIGRVRRHGQKETPHVYRLVALHTIDVDILEHRERRTTALTEQGAPEIVPPASSQRRVVDTEPIPERTQLVREKGRFSLQPQSWLMRCGADDDGNVLDKVQGKRPGNGKLEGEARVKAKSRVLGWEDFSSLIKFSRAFTEDDEE